MARYITIIILIMLLAPNASALELLPRGAHTCSYKRNNKEVVCTMYSNGKGLVFFDGDCDAVQDEVDFVKNNKCTLNRNGAKNYICEQTTKTCYVSIFANGASSTSCKNKTNNNFSSSLEITENLIEKVENGQCRPDL